MKGTHKHMEDSLKRFDDHRCLPQSKESKYLRTLGNEGTTLFFGQF